jgi:hypothetical protein
VDDQGVVAENKGNVVNWAEATIGTAQKKAWCVSSSSILRALGEKSNCSDGSKLPLGLGMSF